MTPRHNVSLQMKLNFGLAMLDADNHDGSLAGRGEAVLGQQLVHGLRQDGLFVTLASICRSRAESQPPFITKAQRRVAS